MAQVDIQLGYKDSAWFTTNATHILLAGQIVYLDQTGTYKIGDGVTQLSALTFLGSITQVNSDWNATSGAAQILNKPTIPAAQIQSDWNQTNNVGLDYIKNKPTIGVGDMVKSVYDVDNTGVVDNAEAIKIVGRNSTGATLRKGTIIYINGSTGNRPNFVKAQANSEATSAGTFGVIDSDLPNNSDGYALCLGYLDNLDTRTTATYPFTSDTLVDGDTIYLDPNNAGYITNVKPSAPNHLVYVGKVTRTSPTNGTIVYRIQNGYELEEIHNMQDISYSTPIDADSLLIKDSTNSLWKRLTFANLKTYLTGLYVGLTGNQTVAGQKTFSDNLTYDNGTVNTKLLPVPTIPTYMGMFMNTATPNSTNATIYKDASGNTFLNGTSVYTASNAINYTRTVSSLFQILTGINLQLVDGTANRVLYLDASKNVKSSSVTDTTLGYLDATSSIQTQLNGKLSTTITSVAKGDTVEYNGSAWVNIGIQYTVELIDALTIDIYAPYGMKINSVTNILNSPTTTILVGGSAYTLGNTITTGQKITVTVSVAAVVTLNINKV
jgi:hypothetical protein